MLKLELNQTFVNSTNKLIYYIVNNINEQGNEQINVEELRPSQSVTNTTAVNSVQIILP